MSAIAISYSATWARDGAMNQATTRIAKLTNATAIISWLLRLNLGIAIPLNGSLCKGSAQISSAVVDHR